MGTDSGKFTPPGSKISKIFASGPVCSVDFRVAFWFVRGLGSDSYEHESAKIVALPQKDSPFTAILSGFGPVVGLWLDSPLYLLMGTNRLKMVSPSLDNVYSRVSLPLFHPWLGPCDRYIY
jgi:hypothetical protein